ncbi:MAG: hypothetical protein F6K29_25790 [Okeania sp. SIO2G5]|nr:hypothetical protein [Okeania sp. SIO2G5]
MITIIEEFADVSNHKPASPLICTTYQWTWSSTKFCDFWKILKCKIAKLHQLIARQRLDWQFKLADHLFSIGNFSPSAVLRRTLNFKIFGIDLGNQLNL